MRPLQPFFFFYHLSSVLLFLSSFTTTAIPIRVDQRHSFSLSTFDPTGKLGQVEAAIHAANQGVPIIGTVVISNDTTSTQQLILAAPQVLPKSTSMMILDDATPRFVKVSSEIVLAHTGIGPDGRVLLEEAQRLAVEYEYTSGDTEIPIQVLLEELSLLFQEYTVKPGVRPFGTTLLVGYLPNSSSLEQMKEEDSESNTEGENAPCFYRIDPSGVVSILGDIAVVNADSSSEETETTNIRNKLTDLKRESFFFEEKAGSNSSPTKQLIHILEESFKQGGDADKHKVGSSDSMRFVTASFSVGGLFSLARETSY